MQQSNKILKHVPQDLWDQIKILAIKKGLSMNEFILSILRREVEKGGE